MQRVLTKIVWVSFEHPHYGSDLIPCNYHMFRPVKQLRLEDNERVEVFVQNLLLTR